MALHAPDTSVTESVQAERLAALLLERYGDWYGADLSDQQAVDGARDDAAWLLERGVLLPDSGDAPRPMRDGPIHTYWHRRREVDPLHGKLTGCLCEACQNERGYQPIGASAPDGLRAALEPFAKEADSIERSLRSPLRDDLLLMYLGKLDLTLGDLRRARAALGSAPRGTEEQP